MVQTNETMESPPFDLQAYGPPISLWEIVKQYVPVHEREEVKNMLGESLIDQSMELHDEVNTLLDIWRDYRDETTKVKPRPVLPEPPGVRDRLIQEIQFYVDNVKEKAKNEGVNADKILSRHNTEIIDYALDTYRPDSARPSSRLTARGGDGRETPMICSPSCSDRTSEASILSEEVEGMNEKLNVLKFDEVVTHLRSTLEEEIETLLKDINFLQNCLDDEATFRAESTGALTREPTLQELKEERTTLEKDLLTSMRSQASPPLKPAFTPDFGKKSLGPNLGSLSRIKSSTNPGASSGSSPLKPGPLKAFTSPEPPKAGKSPSSIHRPNSGVRDKTKTAAIGDHSKSYEHQREERIKSKPGSPNIVRKRTVVGSASVSPQFNKLTSDSSHSVGTSVISETSIKTSSKDPSKAGPQLEAVFTLSKGKSGDATDVHQFIPSPPPSIKPSTPRPSSAQRFRSMVLDCRDSS